MLRVKPTAPFSRRDLVLALDAAKIGVRMLFGGNLVRQPAFANLRKERPNAFRVVGKLTGADQILNEAIFVGTYPGLTDEMLGHIVETIRRFVKR
jgi:CDP-6-deoxy-D-xylo-4-hexulose-3-dehydrase